MSKISIPEPIVHLMECFRPGVDDLQSADFAPLAEWLRRDRRHEQVFLRLQNIHQQISESIHEVLPPQGLADRLRRSALQRTQQISNKTPGRSRQPQTLQRSRGLTKIEARGVARRSWLTPMRWAGISAAAVVLISSFVWFNNSFQSTSETAATPIQPAEVGMEAIDWSNRVQEVNWNRRVEAAPDSRPVYGSLARNAKAWTTLATELDQEAVAYDLSGSDENTIHLFVLRALTGIANVGASFSSTPTYASDMFATGVCQKNDLTYVLVVKGGVDEYHNVVVQAIAD